MTKSFLDLPENSFSPKNFFKSGISIGNGYPTAEKNMKLYPVIGVRILLNNDAARDFIRLQDDLLAAFPNLFGAGIKLRASGGGGFRPIQEQIAEFQKRYSTNPAEFLESVRKSGVNPKSQYFIEDPTFRGNLDALLLAGNSIYKASKYLGRNEPLIVSGEFRGIPPYDKLIQRVKDEHEKIPGLAGHNFLSNKRIKYYFPDGSKESDKWYYMKSIGITQMSTPGNSMHGWGIALDLDASAIHKLEANQAAMQWLIDHIQDYGWSKEKGVDAGSDPYHLIYFGLGKAIAASVNLKPATITKSTTVAPKPNTNTNKYIPFQPLLPFSITPKVVPTGPGNSVRLVKTIDAIIAPPVAYKIGQTGPGGGKIFITPSTPGNHTGRYFEVAPKNWYTGSKSPYLKAPWRNDGPTVRWAVGVGTTAVEIGKGYQNTLAIAARHAVSAAAYSRSYRGGGKTDWFLPSKNELDQLYKYRSLVGGFLADYYWSSSEYDATGAWYQNFDHGWQANYAKSDLSYVRPIRSFPPTEVIPPSATPNYSIVSTYIPAIVTDSKSNNFLQHLQTLIESSPDLALSALNTYVSSDISQRAIDIQVDLLLRASKIGTTVFKFLNDVSLSTLMGPAGGLFMKDLKKHYTPDPSITAPVTVPIDGGGGGSKVMKLVSFESQTVRSIPSKINPDGLSAKIFQVAEPFSENSSGTFLTQDELFNALIHPRIGNFGPALAAILTAIAQREGFLATNKISIGVANGSSHLGFFQFRCRPADLYATNEKGGWVGSALNWFAPYNTEGELVNINPKQPGLSKKYSWEAFIQKQETIKDIKNFLLTPEGKYKKPNQFDSALSLLSVHMPKVKYDMKIGEYEWSKRKNYNETDYEHDIVTVNGKQKEVRIEVYDRPNRVESSAYIADWARIPANQILMLKSKFGLAAKFFDNNKPVYFPYTSQDGSKILTVKEVSKYPDDRYLLNHFNMPNSTWAQGVSYTTARDVLARNASIVDPVNPMSGNQATVWANDTLANFALCLSGNRKTVYLNWLKS